MAKQPIGIAIFGAGRIGAVHARNVAGNPDVQLIGIADVDATAAEKVVAACGGRQDTVQNLLAAAAVDAVVIATSTATHAELIEQAAAAKKHIFCEKPISLDVAATIAAIQACERADVILQIGFQRRFDRDFVDARTAIETGKLGDVRFLRLVSRDRTLPPIAYISSSGGQYKDQMVHDFDAARWLLAPAIVEEVTAVGSATDRGIAQAGDIDTAVALLHYSNGAIAVLDVSREAVYGYDVRAEVHGSRGMLLTGEDGMTNGRVLEGSFVTPRTNSFITRFSDAYRHEIEHFIEIVGDGGTPRADGNDSLHALRIAIAADRSLHERRTIQLADVEGALSTRA